ncbi:hypothetical protein HYH03_010412 [Edaphochlamys debaryana]|uniref:Uncharacterized protein n=1 Tax=Edaphochlamys debaryana TaxID=47281 RepID=A0A836BWP7_9CHLO|nr:hypothetical protein HYH03_010412 [Edaphochlamys debaryana]|eukprot:KAG2491202.1 hypothetical protein HYH03_010412 [Edaphochlamys debaryana]
MESLCANWHQRWPRATKLTLELKDGADAVTCLPRPFTRAPPEAFLCLTHLTVKGGGDVLVTGASLAELLLRVPGVQTLVLEDVSVAVEDEDEAEDEALASALSSLTRLEHLTLSDYNCMPYIQPSLGAQLKTLRVGREAGYDDWSDCMEIITDTEVASCVAHMTGLEELTLEGDLRFLPGGLLAVLDALAPSVRRCKVAEVHVSDDSHGSITWDCSLADGKLLSVALSSYYSTEDAEAVKDVAVFLEEVLLPSRVLGPRLPSLSLDLTLEADDESLKAVMGLYSGIWGLADRCDELHLPSPAGSSAKGGGGDSGGEASGLNGGSAALTPAQVAPRVLERAVQRAMGEAAEGGSHLLFLGPAVSSRLGFPRELRAWVAELSSQAAESLPPQPSKPKPLSHFRPLPSFGALELACGPDAVGAVAEAGRRAGAAVLTAGCGTDAALSQVLGALRSGEEAGGPGAEVSALDRLRWLLETMEAVAALRPPQESL